MLGADSPRNQSVGKRTEKRGVFLDRLVFKRLRFCPRLKLVSPAARRNWSRLGQVLPARREECFLAGSVFPAGRAAENWFYEGGAVRHREGMANLIVRPGWHIPERLVTPEEFFQRALMELKRRKQ